MNNFSYIKAASVQAAIDQSTAGFNVKYIAGGTNLIDLMKYNLTRADTLVDVNRVQENKDIIEMENGGLRLSAFATNAQTAYNPLIERRYPLLSRAILAGASAQIRNMATNGGNLLQRTRCYYFYDANVPCNKREPGSGCAAIAGYNRIMAILGTSESCIAVFPSDMCIALAALEAIVNVEGPEGSRSIPFADFHRLPGDTPHLDNNIGQDEIITSIDLPAKGFSKNYSYLKLRDRNSYAFALVSVASGLDLDGDVIREARIALGGVAHKPWRVEEAEDFLRGKPANQSNFRQAAEMILKGATGYRHNEFKIELAKRAIVRNCMMALNPATQLPGAQPSV
ncbi:FAD binding domain-containing protein [Dyadobacter arcticus]|uniref:Xanthine dehydrogenase YagS FAD-binding subunit n=1 Tax=Dyadobacter arcticus TaxID=1078754 RepID=A0ABX0ULJ9_9BACT|nr:xanthine dehydrogenase family protein subunit M [Dyadobacter arcticus]NIJ53873.1 xanthine dehydrogenase YagS FAD-binding subunit [Dyadobacter arcticus]